MNKTCKSTSLDEWERLIKCQCTRPSHCALLGTSLSHSISLFHCISYICYLNLTVFG